MRTTALVALGGALGATARWGIGQFVAHEPGTFPWATLFANIVGCALIGLAVQRWARSSDMWAFWATGALGGLTTFSAFAVETRGLLEAHRPALAATYVVVSLVAGVGAVELARGARR